MIFFWKNPLFFFFLGEKKALEGNEFFEGTNDVSVGNRRCHVSSRELIENQFFGWSSQQNPEVLFAGLAERSQLKYTCRGKELWFKFLGI